MAIEADEAVRSAGHETCQHKTYAMSCAEFEALLERAGGRCEFCGIASEETARGALVIDHDGRYGWATPRGLLCDPCNSHFRWIEEGKRPVGARESEYFRNSWFVECQWYADDSLPFRRHVDYSTWITFRKAVGGDTPLRGALTNFMRWYLRMPRSYLPTRPSR